MGKLIFTERFGVRGERLLDAPPVENTNKDENKDTAPAVSSREMGVGAEAGIDVQFKPPEALTECPDPEKAHWYSPPRYPQKELRACNDSYTYWALLLSAGLMKESGMIPDSPIALGYHAKIGLSFNWTRAEEPDRPARPGSKLNGANATGSHPLRIGLELVGQYSSLQNSLGAGLGPTMVFGEKVYLSGAYILAADGRPAFYIAMGARDFL